MIGPSSVLPASIVRASALGSGSSETVHPARFHAYCYRLHDILHPSLIVRFVHRSAYRVDRRMLPLGQSRNNTEQPLEVIELSLSRGAPSHGDCQKGQIVNGNLDLQLGSLGTLCSIRGQHREP